MPTRASSRASTTAYDSSPSSPPMTEPETDVFDVARSSAAASTAPSSPPPVNTQKEDDVSMQEEAEGEDEDVAADPETEKRLKHLEFVLNKSAIYAECLRDQMDKHKARQQTFVESSSPPPKAKPTTTRRKSTRGGGGRKRAADDLEEDEDVEEGESAPAAKKKRLNRPGEDAQPGEDPQSGSGSTEGVEEDGGVDSGGVVFQQPSLITGAKMKDYQLEGLQWMVALHQNGISGILADEMGLGKTLQTVAFSAYLRQVTVSPFLVVCPLSVLHNWVEEYEKFAPKIPVCMYHGSKADRAELRRTVMSRSQTQSKPKPKGRGKRRTKSSQDSEDEDALNPLNNHFPVVITTYEMIINDRKFLAEYDWGYIVVDEGHRLKNLDCRLMQEIKKYPSASRMILTGTPLHNNLGELWALLNFVLPDIFNDIESFQEWFNLPTLQSTISTSRSTQIISKLHTILKPFLLRRLKVDVETNLPPKKEYVLYAPLTTRQREAYQEILDGGVRGYLLRQMNQKTKADGKAKHLELEGGVDSVDVDKLRTLRKKKVGEEGKYRILDGDDDAYFEHLEKRGEEEWAVVPEVEQEEVGKEYRRKTAMKQINNMRLQNTVMQLRKVCSHPFLFELPDEAHFQQTDAEGTSGENLVNASGKMMVLERLLDELKKRDHRVLIFSQFTSMLDIIEDWVTDVKGWSICRIDGKTPPHERRDQMRLYQDASNPDRPWLFLLSTRAGGLGINLTAADTVIFYDQDWNPQMDAQAQDRAHRIGQTRPVLIFRLVSAHTIETKIMQRATEKKKLEALVIAKGKFKKPASGPAAARSGKTTSDAAEVAAELLRLEGEKIDVVPSTDAGKASVLSDEDLDMLLDRRPEVFSDRGVGWTSSGDGKTRPVVEEEVEVAKPEVSVAGKKKAAFAVYTAPVEAGNELLAGMLGEEVV